MGNDEGEVELTDKDESSRLELFEGRIGKQTKADAENSTREKLNCVGSVEKSQNHRSHSWLKLSVRLVLW